MDQIYYVYHDETYMQINLTTQPRTPERNKVTDSGKKCTKRVFSSKNTSKKVLQYLSHWILRYVYGAVNVDEKKLIAQFGWKSRDERFEPN